MPCIIVPNEGPAIFKDGGVAKEIAGPLSLGYAIELIQKALNNETPNADGKALKE